MRRRDLLACGAALPIAMLARPAAIAQSGAAIGWLSYFKQADAATNREAFLRGMAECGRTLGRDFHLVERYADEQIEAVSIAAREFASRPVMAIVTYGPAIARVLDAKLAVPVVYAFSGDPIDAGFTNSLARPERNATGIAYLAAELNAKRIEILKEIAPQISRVALLSNPLHAGEPKELAVARDATARLGIELYHLSARDTASLEVALADPVLGSVGALIALSDILTLRNRRQIVEAATRRHIPAVSGLAAFARSGCLFSYGPVLASVYQRLATQVDRILRGAAPSDLPIEQPTRFELVINLKTATALGLTIPPSLLARTDEVIE